MHHVAKIRVPFGRPSIDERDIDVVSKVLRTGWIAYGPQIEEFESALADYTGAAAAVTLNSCTSALEAVLLQAGIRGEVIAPSFTWVAVANAICNAGARPIFADVDERTFNLTPKSVVERIGASTEAVILPHYGGQPADIEGIQRVCAARGLLLVEDCAETMGGRHRNRLAGSTDIGCFSFYPTKAITTGMGGAVVGRDAAFIDGIRTLATHGLQSSTPVDGTPHCPWERAAVMPGRNLRMPNLLAALGLEQLRRLNSFNEARRAVAAAYDERLANMETYLIRPFRDPEAHHVFQMYSVRVTGGQRDHALQELWRKGISANCHFDPPIHVQPWYAATHCGYRGLEVTERLRSEILTLPIFPDMTAKQIDLVADVLCGALERV